MIAAESTVIIVMNEDKSSHMLKVSGVQKLFKKNVDVTCMVGQPLGSIFELQGDTLVRLTDSELYAGELTEVRSDEKEVIATEGSATVSKGDNRNYVDTNTAQRLKPAEVRALRESGTKGEEIIQKLVENSATWDKKTDYAQEKYLTKKKKKYLKRFRVIEATPLTMCEVYEIKSRDKICAMRPDTLSHILSHSGVYAGCRVLLFESLVGLITSTIALRMRGEGLIVSLFEAQQPRAEVIDFLNLDEASGAIIQPVSTVELGPASKDVREKGFYSDKKRKIDELSPEALVPPAPKGDHAPPKKITRPYLRTNRQHADKLRMAQLLREGFHSLIIASRFNPLPIVKTAIPLMHPSSSIVIYSEYVEPLTECFLYLQTNALAVRLTITENWLRWFQTLPGREHPENYMRSSGGFVLTGVTVDAQPRVPQIRTGGKQVSK